MVAGWLAAMPDTANTALSGIHATACDANNAVSLDRSKEPSFFLG